MQEYEEQGFLHPARLWLPLEEIEHKALDQIRNASQHPELGASLAVMPDCHVGYGIPIGTAMLTSNSIIPYAVGVDIGCGMSAVRTNIVLTDTMDKTFWRTWAELVRGAIPTGNGWFDKPTSWSGFDVKLRVPELETAKNEIAALQIGTLGGGNHFLEAQVDEDGFVWVMVHSGSRRIGKMIADYYHAKAVEESKKRGLKTVTELSSLTLDDDLAWDYVNDMAWAMRYAKESRRLMIDRMLDLLLEPTDEGERIDCYHNYVDLHTNMDVLHRKGATSARSGEPGIIPGSMGTSSFIVMGRGNTDSHESCSHGAGRTMGRNAAKKKIADIAELEQALAGTHTRADFRNADEAPHAYKDIGVVIDRQRDLIVLEHILQPLITVKGGGRNDG